MHLVEVGFVQQHQTLATVHLVEVRSVQQHQTLATVHHVEVRSVQRPRDPCGDKSLHTIALK